MKIERLNVAAAIMIDGVTKMHCDTQMADIEYDPTTQIYTITGKKHGQITLVHSTNIQWSRPLVEENGQKARGPGRPRTPQEA